MCAAILFPVSKLLRWASKYLRDSQKQVFSLLLLSLLPLLPSCVSKNLPIEPQITYCPPERLIRSLENPFPPLSFEEMRHPYAKEYFLGIEFAKQGDYFRAIGSFYRAKFLFPPEERLLEIDFFIILSYYINCKYCDVIQVFEASSLAFLPLNFPARADLLIMIGDSYARIDMPCKKDAILQHLDPQQREDLEISNALLEGNISYLLHKKECPPCQETAQLYLANKKNPGTAKTLNAVLPGLGYSYLGLHKTAFTSLIVNSIFIITTYQLFERGYVAMGAFTASLELGWYFGGIDGAGIAARTYNERLYEGIAKNVMIEQKLFPVLMLQKGF